MVRVFHSMVEAFSGTERALTALQISRRLEIPLNLVQQLISELMDAGLVVKVDKLVGKNPVFQPARSPEDMTIKDILDIYEGLGRTSLEAGSEHARIVAEYLKDIEQAAAKIQTQE